MSFQRWKLAIITAGYLISHCNVSGLRLTATQISHGQNLAMINTLFVSFSSFERNGTWSHDSPATFFHFTHLVITHLIIKKSMSDNNKHLLFLITGGCLNHLNILLQLSFLMLFLPFLQPKAIVTIYNFRHFIHTHIVSEILFVQSIQGPLQTPNPILAHVHKLEDFLKSFSV